MFTYAPATNLARGILASGIPSGASSLTLSSGASKFNDPAMDGEYDVVIFNSTDYIAPELDPDAEYMTVTAKSGSVLSITKAQQGTSDNSHNTSGKTYTILMTFDKKNYDAIWTAVNTLADGYASVASGFGTDNALIRADGTGRGLQASGITIDDSDNISGINNVTGSDTNLVTGTAGTSGNISEWNSDGDLVDGGVATSDIVTKVSTPSDNQLAIWTGDGTIEGDANLTWDGSDLSISGDIIVTDGQVIKSSAQSTTNYLDLNLGSGNVGISAAGSVFYDSDGDNSDSASLHRFRTDAGTVTLLDIQSDGDVVTTGYIYIANGKALNFNSGDVTITHSSNALTMSGGDFVFDGTGTFRTNTSDGSDTGFLVITGGGASGTTRGSRMFTFGNEHATNPGEFWIQAPGADGVLFYTSTSNDLQWQIDENGTLIGQNSNAITGVSNITFEDLSDISWNSGEFTITHGGTNLDFESSNSGGNATIYLLNDQTASNSQAVFWLGADKSTNNGKLIYNNASQDMFLSNTGTGELYLRSNTDVYINLDHDNNSSDKSLYVTTDAGTVTLFSIIETGQVDFNQSINFNIGANVTGGNPIIEIGTKVGSSNEVSGIDFIVGDGFGRDYNTRILSTATGNTLQFVSHTLSGSIFDVDFEILQLGGTGSYISMVPPGSGQSTPSILFENSSTTADATINPYQDANGTDIWFGSNYYLNGGTGTRYNTGEESSFIAVNRAGNIYLGTGGTGGTATTRMSINSTGDILITSGNVLRSSVASTNYLNLDTSGNILTEARGSYIIGIDSDNNGTGSNITFRKDASTTIFQITELAVATLGTTSNANDVSFTINSQQKAFIHINSDSDNTDETDTAYIKYTQDGGGATYWAGAAGNGNALPDETALTGINANDFVLGASTGTGLGYAMLGTNSGGTASIAYQYHGGNLTHTFNGNYVDIDAGTTVDTNFEKRLVIGGVTMYESDGTTPVSNLSTGVSSGDLCIAGPSGAPFYYNGSAWTSLGGGGGGLADVVDDTSPQLGGALDVNGFNITGNSGANYINITGGNPIIYSQGSYIIHFDGNNDSTSEVISMRSNGSTIVWELGETGLIKYRTTAGITASTTQSQGQGALTTFVNEVSTVANTNDTVTLPTAATGYIVVIINNGANTLQIFPASGDNLGAGLNTATTLAAGSSVMYVAYSSSNWRPV